MGKLTSKQRKSLPSSDFVFPKSRKYPIEDKAHAIDALSRSSGKPASAAVRKAVHEKFPELGAHPKGKK